MKKIFVLLGVGGLIVLLALVYVGVFVGEGMTEETIDESLDRPFLFDEMITVKGAIACLPHRDQTGPQTMECALGLKKANDTYFGLSGLGDDFVTNGLSVGDAVSVTGRARERNPEGRYAVLAVIEVRSFAPLSNLASSSQTYVSKVPKFSITFPAMFEFAKDLPIEEAWWSNISEEAGETLLVIHTRPDFLGETNFRSARVSVGRSNEQNATGNCLDIKNKNPQATTEPVTINGTDFTKFHYIGGAAGGRYDTTSYRTFRDGFCYAIETVLSYSAIEMYGEDSNVEKFDKADVKNILKQIVSTFSFQ